MKIMITFKIMSTLKEVALVFKYNILEATDHACSSVSVSIPKVVTLMPTVACNLPNVDISVSSKLDHS